MREQLTDDSGIALVVVIAAIGLISILAVGGFYLSTQTVYSSQRLMTEEKAFQTASSGLDRVLATFSQSTVPQGQVTSQVSGTTPDGEYLVTIGRDPSVPYRYSIICTGTAGAETARVRQDFYYLDLWSVNIGQGENPGSPPGTAGDFNGGPEIHGPFFVAGGSFNSNPDFYGGPLFVSQDVVFKAGTGWYPEPSGTKYVIFAGGTCSGYEDALCTVQYSCPDLELPWVAADYMDAMLDSAIRQSTDGVRGDGDPAVANGEITTDTALYSGVRFPGQSADAPYKVIEPDPDGPVTIDGTSSFGKVTKNDPLDPGSPVMNWDDFAFDPTTGTLYVEGIVYVKDDVTIGPGVKNYRGSGIIVSDGDVIINTPNQMFQPWNGGSGATDLTAEDTLAFVAENITLGTDTGFEGTAFCNATFELGQAAVFQGAIHANLITNPTPPKAQIWMEEGMAPYKVPSGMPGTSTDPRGNNYGGGVVIPGTWSRLQ